MPAAFSSAFSAVTRSWVVLMRYAGARSIAESVAQSDTDRRRIGHVLEFGTGRRPPPQDAAVFNTPRQMTPCNSHPIRHDTSAWKLQVWLSFGVAASLCAIGLACLPGADLDRAFMVMGYMFCLSTAFALAKYVRDNESRRIDTPMWGLVVWGGFALAMALTGWGLVRMDISPTYKAFLGVSWLFLISTTFTLAKTLRDAHEAALAEARRRGLVDAAAARVRATARPFLSNLPGATLP